MRTEELRAHIGVPLEMFVDQPDGRNRRNQGKGSGDNPSYLHTAVSVKSPRDGAPLYMVSWRFRYQLAMTRYKQHVSRTLEVKVSIVVQRRSILRDFLGVTASADKPDGVMSPSRHKEEINKEHSR